VIAVDGRGKKENTAMKEEALHSSMGIEWSEEDQAYLVRLPERAETNIMPVTHGKTYHLPLFILVNKEQTDMPIRRTRIGNDLAFCRRRFLPIK
jgi:hypothetical protein